MERLYVCVEYRDGHTFWQEIEWKENDTVSQAILNYELLLGKGYHICDWRVDSYETE